MLDCDSNFVERVCWRVVNNLKLQQIIAIDTTSINQQTTTPNTVSPKNNLSFSILMGLSASALVPLFLSLVSSPLLSNILHDGKIENLFVLLGFCLAAAISGGPFVEEMVAKINRH